MIEIELSTLDLRYEGHRMRDRAGEARMAHGRRDRPDRSSNRVRGFRGDS